MLLEPKEIEVNGKQYVIHKFPAVQGREIVLKYPLSGLPKIGDYKVNEETMLKLMSYVGVAITPGSPPLMLSNQELVNNHVRGWDTLTKIEKEVLEYNNAFFLIERVLTSWQGFAQKLQRSSVKTLIRSLELLSKKVKQHFKN